MILKRTFPSKIVLLLGNHDLAYLFPGQIETTRHDWNNHDKIQNLLLDNIDLFQLTYTTKTLQKITIMSHAGIHPEWIKQHPELFPQNCTIASAAEIMNELFLTKQYQLLIPSLGECAKFRGGNNKVGSPVWCDIQEWTDTQLDANEYQIFGHTKMGDQPLVTRYFSCIDCGRAFIYK